MPEKKSITPKEAYQQYLKGEHWAKTRKAALTYWGAKCNRCRSKKNLNIHHRHYKTVGHENVKTDLEVLCSPCHEKHHRDEKAGHSKPTATPTRPNFKESVRLHNQKVKAKSKKQKEEDWIAAVLTVDPTITKNAKRKKILKHRKLMRIQKEQKRLRQEQEKRSTPKEKKYERQGIMLEEFNRNRPGKVRIP